MAYDDTMVVGYLRRAHDTTLLSEREKHLLGLAVTITRGCQVCTRNRIEKRGAGLGDDVLNALVERRFRRQRRRLRGDGPRGVPPGRRRGAEEACGDLCSPKSGIDHGCPG